MGKGERGAVGRLQEARLDARSRMGAKGRSPGCPWLELAVGVAVGLWKERLWQDDC